MPARSQDDSRLALLLSNGGSRVGFFTCDKRSANIGAGQGSEAHWLCIGRPISERGARSGPDLKAGRPSIATVASKAACSLLSVSAASRTFIFFRFSRLFSLLALNSCSWRVRLRSEVQTSVWIACQALFCHALLAASRVCQFSHLHFLSLLSVVLKQWHSTLLDKWSPDAIHSHFGHSRSHCNA